MPNWAARCPITVRVGPSLGAGVATSFLFDRGEEVRPERKSLGLIEVKREQIVQDGGRIGRERQGLVQVADRVVRPVLFDEPLREPAQALNLLALFRTGMQHRAQKQKQRGDKQDQSHAVSTPTGVGACIVDSPLLRVDTRFPFLRRIG